MKVLSLLQPWASLVVMGIKTVETRSWSTNYRGSLLIHAGLRKAGGLILNNSIINQHIPSFKELPYGGIIGLVTLENVFLLKNFTILVTLIN